MILKDVCLKSFLIQQCTEFSRTWSEIWTVLSSECAYIKFKLKTAAGNSLSLSRNRKTAEAISHSVATCGGAAWRLLQCYCLLHQYIIYHMFTNHNNHNSTMRLPVRYEPTIPCQIVHGWKKYLSVPESVAGVSCRPSLDSGVEDPQTPSSSSPWISDFNFEN